MARACYLLACLTLLALPGCDDEGPALDPNMKTFEQAQKEAKQKAPAPAAPAPVDDGKERVLLKWGVTAEQPLALQARLAPGAGAAIDPRALVTGDRAPDLAAALGATSGGPVLTASLQGLSSGELAVRARVEGAAAPGALGRGYETLRAKGKLRANMSRRGFITTDLDRGLRNALALMFELPPEPVAVGDTWRSSVDLAGAGPDFVEREGLRRNEARLVALEPDEKGRRVAVVETVVARHQVGRMTTLDRGAADASLETALLARGRFSVDEGRWLSVEARAITRGKGALAQASDERVSVTLARNVPPDLLEDPPPAPLAAREVEDDGHGHAGHAHAAPAPAVKKAAAKAPAKKKKR
jgi:hypothetical protein